MCACILGCFSRPAADANIVESDDSCIICNDKLSGPYVSHSSSEDLTNFTCLIHKGCQEAYNKVGFLEYVVAVDDAGNRTSEQMKLNRCAQCRAGINNQFITSYPNKAAAKIQMVVDRLFLENALEKNLTAVRALLGGPVSLPLKEGVLHDGNLADLWRVVQSDNQKDSFRQQLRMKIRDVTENPTEDNRANLTAFIEQSKERAKKHRDSLDDLRFDAFMMICAGDKTSPDLLGWILEGNKWEKGAINWAIFHLARLGKVEALNFLLLQEGKKATLRGIELALKHAQENCVELLMALNPDPDSKE